jgi:hypothetical protein
MANSPSDDLFPDARNPKGMYVINERCRLITRDGHRVVLVSGMLMAQYVQGDRMSEAHAMVSAQRRQTIATRLRAPRSPQTLGLNPPIHPKPA